MQAFFNAAPAGLECLKGAANFHSMLNAPGYVPFLGTITGAFRAVCAVAASIFFHIAAEFTSDTLKKIDFKASAIVHQALIGRGLIEMIPFVGGYILYNQDKAIDDLLSGNMSGMGNMGNMPDFRNMGNMPNFGNMGNRRAW